MKKAFYKSKTFWANLIAIIAILFTGEEVDSTISGTLLAFLNIVLRLITKTELNWN